MKMRIPFLQLLFILSFWACQRDNDGPNDVVADETPAELLSILDSLPESTNFQPDNILLPNGMMLRDYLEESDSAFAHTWLRGGDPYSGMSPLEARSELIARLSAAAWNLCNRSLHQYPAAGADSPEQNGLGYSWGAKDHTKREAPPGANSYCTHKIYGLDCSGFLYQVFLAAGVTIPKGRAQEQSRFLTLENALHSASPALQKMTVRDMGKVNPNTALQIGDILYWENADSAVVHIGVVLTNNAGQKAIYQSVGRNSSASGQCDLNLGPKRGPRSALLTASDAPSIYNNCYLLRIEAASPCGCPSGSELCAFAPSKDRIELALQGFSFQPGPGTKEEAKAILKYLCADIVHEYTYSDGVIFVCGVLPTGYEITLWSPSFNLTNGYGVRYGSVQDHHSYFGNNDLYFEIVK